MFSQHFQPFPPQSLIPSNQKLQSSTILWLPRCSTFAQPILECNCVSETRAISSIELPPNALRRKLDPHWRGGFSLGVDLGTSRTGLALSKGFSTRPLTVLELRGHKLEVKLIEIAEQEEADEFIIGLPKSSDGKETPQSNKIRSIAGRVAARAAERGLNKSTRQKKIDAYAAMMVLERYYFMSGQGTELVVPKSLVLQEKLIEGPPTDPDFKD
ncbi:uncharacterized protein LOC111014097 isoform X2 [Momordica charantia]|uniref:Uncharacterized protein LOC111014097 isoform X2 n=1 Tax=Momordica charantia TaxID=3673 RepID=A0A6J1CTM3_MOMCH|nr:uncharacterized protein LOC111014097 isoform X2 [Momordica charantia]